ncbi:hypothetical protein LPJ61_002378 [Coemansia biformis]|uniref:Uncharacterized protein n=1 Tax=Coemansia biformis TaxID=1286918 RepID=A0A9W7YF47_9FUNG|nr:hypothetical protein LPJ61_002378 [Coemansia biformis]
MAVVTKRTPISLTPNEESLVREQLARHYAFLGEGGHLAGFPTEPLAVKGRGALYARLQRELGNREKDRGAAHGGPQLHMSTMR